MAEKEIKMGGQAVIEGVMMRSASKWAVAVRSPEGEIVVKEESWTPVAKKFPLLRLPIMRGAVVLFEALILGIKALNFSADIAASEEEKEKSGDKKEPSKFMQNLYIFLTIGFSFSVGLLLFFYLPLVLTEMMGIENKILFNVVDGILRVGAFLIYLYAISRWKEIKRVFEYHGAEHKTIFAYEDEKALDWCNIEPYTTFHPRCGTSFILVLMLVSILVFMFLGKPTNISERLIRMAFIPLIGGISYELIRLSDRYSENPLVKALIAPGLWMQRITTRPPDESQVQVAVVALESALGIRNSETELQPVQSASVS